MEILIRMLPLSQPLAVPLTNVDDVAVPIYHDVAVVSVLDLQDVADQGIGRHALDEVSTGLHETMHVICIGVHVRCIGHMY